MNRSATDLRRETVDRVRKTLNHYGGSLDPHAGFLLARSIKTLALRVRAQNQNAMALATFLAGHPGVTAVSSSRVMSTEFRG